MCECLEYILCDMPAQGSQPNIPPSLEGGVSRSLPIRGIRFVTVALGPLGA